ncbi:MAG: TetR/AcrR family transcriptional regulator [Acidobacteriota bacterium]
MVDPIAFFDPASDDANVRQALTTEERLLHAARGVFAQKGLHGASTKEITAAAGVQKSTLHYYYRHKEDLYAAVFERAYDEMIQTLATEITPGMPFADVLRAFVVHHVRAYADNPVTVHLWMQENLIGAPVAVPVLERYHHQPGSPYRLFVEALQAAIASGEVRPVDPAQTFVSVMGACLFFHIARPSMVSSLPSLLQRPEEAIDVDRFLEEREMAVFELVYRGLAA